MRDERGTRIPVQRGGTDQRRSAEPEPVPSLDGDINEAGTDALTPPEEAEAVVEGQGSADWREAALRLKAEMENFRKRQKRWAEDEVLREQEQFLRPFLGVVDDLEQALKHIDLRDPAHQGVRVVYDGVMSLLMRQGVERMAAEGQLFDPHNHEAVAAIPASEAGVEDMHVVAVTQPGYVYTQKGTGAERVLRPAKVIVAKQGA
ncbi:MAG: nucleotide exchange factor GrpE [Anaerolineae bacterium]|nr:nucleotide exchange factor GrpE [Anaerolineae bacterium]